MPAFVGLGAPYWDAECRGALYGLTRATGPKEIARAALECVCYQTLDLLEAMRADWPEASGAQTVLRVDGGMVASDWTMQRLADILGAPVDRPVVNETTALGAAFFAGLRFDRASVATSSWAGVLCHGLVHVRANAANVVLYSGCIPTGSRGCG